MLQRLGQRDIIRVHGKYDPQQYWEGRLGSQSALRGTGHISFTEGYNQWLYKAKLRALERAVNGVVLSGRRVLDVGCGSGFFVDWYTRQGSSVDGVDITSRSIASLSSRFPGKFRQLDVSAAGNPPLEAYDVVNVWDVLYHVVDDDGFARALRLIAGAVAPGGLLLITDRLAAASDVRAAPHVRMRCLATYQQQLAPLGLELAGHHFLFGWLNRYVTHPAVDSRLGRFYYWLDGRARVIPGDSVSLGVWRRSASS